MIWKCAASSPRDVVLTLDNLGFCYAEPHPLLRVCRESRRVCLLIKDRLQLQRGDKTQELAVDLACDFFFIRPVGCLPASWPDAVSDLKRVAIFWVYVNLTLIDLLDVDEFWMIFGSEPEEFRPVPASEFRRHCHLHHCDWVAAKYFPLSPSARYRQPGLQERCPTCFWHAELDIPTRDGISPTLRATLHPSLPLYPTEHDLNHSECPVVRWIKREHKGDMQDRMMQTRLDEGAVACLLDRSDICIH